MADKRHPDYLLLNGELVPYADAKVHVLSTAFKYGATVFCQQKEGWFTTYIQIPPTASS